MQDLVERLIYFRDQQSSRDDKDMLADACNAITALRKLVEAIDRRWEGEAQRKRDNAVSPRMEEAIAEARKILD